jgi:hypothetical protein
VETKLKVGGHMLMGDHPNAQFDLREEKKSLDIKEVPQSSFEIYPYEFLCRQSLNFDFQ